jgi:hypothetical protein
MQKGTKMKLLTIAFKLQGKERIEMRLLLRNVLGKVVQQKLSQTIERARTMLVTRKSE